MTKLCLRAATLLALAFVLAAPASAVQKQPPSCGGVGPPIGFGGCSAGFCQAPTGVCNIIVQNTGSCTLVPRTCVNLNKPVCGCDLRTYKNDCARRQARVSKLKEGVC
jgi:hypothetical protein